VRLDMEQWTVVPSAPGSPASTTEKQDEGVMPTTEKKEHDAPLSAPLTPPPSATVPHSSWWSPNAWIRWVWWSGSSPSLLPTRRTAPAKSITRGDVRAEGALIEPLWSAGGRCGSCRTCESLRYDGRAP
jgi:hypothetical protein